MTQDFIYAQDVILDPDTSKVLAVDPKIPRCSDDVAIAPAQSTSRSLVTQMLESRGPFWNERHEESTRHGFTRPELQRLEIRLIARILNMLSLGPGSPNPTLSYTKFSLTQRRLHSRTALHFAP